MQMRQKLVQQSGTLTPDKKSEYFIDRYNDVIDVYNNSTQTPDIHLQKLDNNELFKKINRIMSKALIKVLIVLVMLFAPVVNLFLFGFLCFYYLFLRKQGKTHKQNLRRVNNPLQSFYFLPQVCQQLGKHCTTLQIKTKDVQGFTFNQNLYQQIKQKSKINQTDTITVTIYDQYFYDSFHLLKKEQYKIGAWMVLSIALIALGTLFYLFIFDLY